MTDQHGDPTVRPEPSRQPTNLDPIPTSGGRARWLLICLVIGIVVFGGGYWYFHRSGAEPAPQAAGAAPPALPVTVSKPLKAQVTEWDEFTGQFQAVEFVEIRARVSGYLDYDRLRGRPDRQQGRSALRHRPPALRDRRSNRRKAQLNRRGAGDARRAAARTRAAEAEGSDFTPQSALDQRQQELRSASADAQWHRRRSVRPSSISNSPISRRRLTGRIGAHQVSIGNLDQRRRSAAAPTLLTTIVSLDPIRFDFDMSEDDYPRLSARRGRGQDGLQARRPMSRSEARLTDEDDWPQKG